MVNKNRVIDPETISEGDILIGIPSSGIHSNGFTLVRRVIEDNDLSLVSPLEEVISSPSWKNRSSLKEYRVLVEEWFEQMENVVLGEVILTPTRIYVGEILELISKVGVETLHGMAHITGGGIRNLSRMKPNLGFVVENPLEPPAVFRMIQVLGSVEEKEMYQTFNMGMGFVIAVDPHGIDDCMDVLEGSGASVIGRVVDEPGVRIPGLELEYDGYV